MKPYAILPSDPQLPTNPLHPRSGPMLSHTNITSPIRPPYLPPTIQPLTFPSTHPIQPSPIWSPCLPKHSHISDPIILTDQNSTHHPSDSTVISGSIRCAMNTRPLWWNFFSISCSFEGKVDQNNILASSPGVGDFPGEILDPPLPIPQTPITSRRWTQTRLDPSISVCHNIISKKLDP